MFGLHIIGWIHRSTLKQRGVVEVPGCSYIEVNDTGIVVEVDGTQQTLEVLLHLQLIKAPTSPVLLTD